MDYFYNILKTMGSFFTTPQVTPTTPPKRETISRGNQNREEYIRSIRERINSMTDYERRSWLHRAARDGLLTVIGILLTEYGLDPREFFNEYNPNTPTVREYSVLEDAILGDQLEAVQYLLSDPRVDPREDNYRAIRTAFYTGPYVPPYRRIVIKPNMSNHYEIMEALLSDPRVNHNDPLIREIDKKYSYSF